MNAAMCKLGKSIMFELALKIQDYSMQTCKSLLKGKQRLYLNYVLLMIAKFGGKITFTKING